MLGLLIATGTVFITITAWTQLGFWYAFTYVMYTLVVGIWLLHRDAAREPNVMTFVSNPYVYGPDDRILPHTMAVPGTMTHEQYMHLMRAHLDQFYGDEGTHYRQITRERMQQRLNSRADLHHPPLTNDQMDSLDEMWNRPAGGKDIEEVE